MKYARHIRLAKEGGWIIAGQLISVLASLTLVRVLTEILSPAQYGQLALGLTVASLMNQTILGGVVQGINRFYSIALESQELGAYLHAALNLLGYATLVAMGVGLSVVIGLIWLEYTQWIGLAVAALIFSVLSGYSSAITGIQTAARNRAVVTVHSSFDAGLRIALALCFVSVLGASSTAVVIGYASSSLLITTSQFIFLQIGRAHV